MDPNTASSRPSGSIHPTRPVGVLLAGGESRRLGADKSLLPHPRGTLLDWAWERLAAVCDEVLVANRKRHPHPASVDDGPGAGPAAGILGAAVARPGRSLLVLACDLPAVPAALLAQLWLRAADGAWDWVLPGGRQIQPLCAVYGPKALSVLERRVEDRRLSLHGLLDEPALRILHVAEDELASFGRPESLFRNLNTEADVERWLQASARKEPPR